ncbi:MAG: hypothetical protein K0A89_07515 [ANME-2 cluster archaeon]|nr:hypothetical protein [ANME-2 cluster archaeon]
MRSVDIVGKERRNFPWHLATLHLPGQVRIIHQQFSHIEHMPYLTIAHLLYLRKHIPGSPPEPSDRCLFNSSRLIATGCTTGSTRLYLNFNLNIQLKVSINTRIVPQRN